MLYRGMALTSIIPLYVFDGVFVYGRLIISLSEYFIGESSAAEVIVAYPFVNLL